MLATIFAIYNSGVFISTDLLDNAFYPKSSKSFKASSIERISFGESLPNFFRISIRSIVDMADFMADGFNSPASFQSSIRHSPTPETLLVWLVTAIMTQSADRLLYASELMITAGRFLIVV